jgi:hypothetical protein
MFRNKYNVVCYSLKDLVSSMYKIMKCDIRRDPVQLILKLNAIRSVSKQTLLFIDRQTIKLDSHLFVVPSRMNYHDQVQAVFEIIGRGGIMICRISAALPQTNKNCC